MTTHDDGKLSGVGVVDTADYMLAVVDVRDDGLVILKCHSIEDDMNREQAIPPVIAGTTTPEHGCMFEHGGQGARLAAVIAMTGTVIRHDLVPTLPLRRTPLPRRAHLSRMPTHRPGRAMTDPAYARLGLCTGGPSAPGGSRITS